MIYRIASPWLIKRFIDRNYGTLAGLLIYKFRRIPEMHDRIVYNGYEFTVQKKAEALLRLFN